jgi:spore maturation protein CgeB
MRLVFLGLSLSSSWGNGHATTYRALLRALARRGHDILFLEREQPWYAASRDLRAADYCELAFYDSPAGLRRFSARIAAADAVIVGSYVPDGVAVIEQVAGVRRGALCFYDIDTPVTLRKLAAGDTEYLRPDLVPLFDLYLSFTGGPSLAVLEEVYGASAARALYCAVDPALYHHTGNERRWALGYLGTYSADRQPALERLLLAPARLSPDLRFVVAGSLYPPDIAWPANVERIEHLPPADHAAFYSSLGWALNVTRADMVRAGYSPSVRLFEATACGTPVISDQWPGLETVFLPGRDLLVAESTGAVLHALRLPEADRAAIGAAGRERTLRDHTADQRAWMLEQYLEQIGQRTGAEIEPLAVGGAGA